MLLKQNNSHSVLEIQTVSDDAEPGIILSEFYKGAREFLAVQLPQYKIEKYKLNFSDALYFVMKDEITFSEQDISANIKTNPDMILDFAKNNQFVYFRRIPNPENIVGMIFICEIPDAKDEKTTYDTDTAVTFLPLTTVKNNNGDWVLTQDKSRKVKTKKIADGIDLGPLNLNSKKTKASLYKQVLEYKSFPF